MIDLTTIEVFLVKYFFSFNLKRYRRTIIMVCLVPICYTGGPLLQKNWDFWDIKFQIFGAEGAEIFEKFRIFSEKLAIFFGVLRENLAEF